MVLKRNTFMLMPPSIGFLNRGKTKYIKIYKGPEMKNVKMKNTLTACVRETCSRKTVCSNSPRSIYTSSVLVSTRLSVTPVDSVCFQWTPMNSNRRVFNPS